MFFLPSYDRPSRLAELANAPGGMPEDILVLLNEDDPQLEIYRRSCPWKIETVAAGSRLVDALEESYARHPNEEFYGFLSDDQWQIDPGWDKAMIEAAEDRYVVHPNGDNTCWPLMRGPTFGAGKHVLKALGGVMPPGFGWRHNFIDVVWCQIGDDVGFRRGLEHYHVHHIHWRFTPGVATDASYDRSSKDQQEDYQRYSRWMSSENRTQAQNYLRDLS